jgi:hypothetical protein
MKLKKGDKVIYLGAIHYGLANGQEAFKENEELVIREDVIVQDGYFKKVVKDKANKTKDKPKAK